MGKRSRAVWFILVNILISASITLSVLWLWERAHPRPEVLISCPPATAVADSPNSDDGTTTVLEEAVSLPNLNEDLAINIRTIVGAGDLTVEYVEIINQGQNPADLTAWQLAGQNGQTFTFPALILNSGGAIKVFSKAGTNSVIELFWQSDQPIWRSGEAARLMDATGELVSTYTIP
ncbi:MAG: lamin tail domain-containing protein [Brevefilum sp.]